MTLADIGYAQASGLTIGQTAYDSGTDGQWQLNPLANGYYELINEASRLALVDIGYQLASGNTIGQGAYDGGTDGQWQFVLLSNGFYEIINRASGLVLADLGYAQGNGYTIGQATYDNGTDWQWQVTAISGGGAGYFVSALAESTFESVPSQSQGATCTDITGYWIESTNPQAAWTLTQSSQTVSGTVTVSVPLCGNVVWQVSGQVTTPSTGLFTLNTSSPQPSMCQNQPFLNTTDTVTLVGPTCLTGNGTHTDASGSNPASWEDPDPPATPVPTSLELTLGQKKTYTNQAVFYCNGNPAGVSGWGYQRCAVYTLLDQTGKAILNSNQWFVDEEVTVVMATYKANPFTQSHQQVNDDGRVQDDLSWTNSSGPIPANTKSVKKQVVTISNSDGTEKYQVRVNCIVLTTTDVSVNDVTNNADQSCTNF